MTIDSTSVVMLMGSDKSHQILGAKYTAHLDGNASFIVGVVQM